MATLSSLSRGIRAAPVASRRPAAARRAGARRTVVVASSAAPAPSSSPADEQPSRVSGGVIGAGGVGTIGSTLRAALPSDYAKAKIKVRDDGGMESAAKTRGHFARDRLFFSIGIIHRAVLFFETRALLFDELFGSLELCFSAMSYTSRCPEAIARER